MTVLTSPTPSPASEVATPPVVLRDFDDQTGDWLRTMQAVAPLLGVAYPGGHSWLGRRLDDVADGKALAHLALLDGEVCGVAIESPKTPGDVKLSTLWVADSVRGYGFGRQLVGRCVSRWLTNGIQRSWVTANRDAVDSICRLVLPAGFLLTARERDRYGNGRDEWVLHWTPEQHYAALSSGSPQLSSRS